MGGIIMDVVIDVNMASWVRHDQIEFSLTEHSLATILG